MDKESSIFVRDLSKFYFRCYNCHRQSMNDKEDYCESVKIISRDEETAKDRMALMLRFIPKEYYVLDYFTTIKVTKQTFKDILEYLKEGEQYTNAEDTTTFD